MVLSEVEAEVRLSDLRRQRDAIDRAITDLTLYLELGRRLTTAPPLCPLPSDPMSADGISSQARPDLLRSDLQASAVPFGTAPRTAPRTVPEDAEHVPSARPASSAVPETKSASIGTGPASDDAFSGVVSEGALARRYGRALIEAAVAVLDEADRPLHVSEILARLDTRGFSVPGQQDPVAALNTRLWKRSGPGGPVRRLGDAVYALPESSDISDVDL